MNCKLIVHLVLLPIITSTTLKQGYLSKKQHSCRIEETNQDTVVVKARTPRSRKVQNGQIHGVHIYVERCASKEVHSHVQRICTSVHRYGFRFSVVGEIFRLAAFPANRSSFQQDSYSHDDINDGQARSHIVIQIIYTCTMF